MTAAMAPATPTIAGITHFESAKSEMVSEIGARPPLGSSTQLPSLSNTANDIPVSAKRVSSVFARCRRSLPAKMYKLPNTTWATIATRTAVPNLVANRELSPTIAP
jgi:hypothetical protein